MSYYVYLLWENGDEQKVKIIFNNKKEALKSGEYWKNYITRKILKLKKGVSNE